MGSRKQQLQPSEHSRSPPPLLPLRINFLSLVRPSCSPATSNYPCNHTLSIRHTNTIMPADAVRSLSATNDVERIEAPLTADVAAADYALSGSHLSLITSILSAG